MDERETGKILEIVKRTDINVSKIFETITDHGERISIIEKTRPTLTKIIAGVSIAIGLILTAFSLIKHI